MPVVPRKIVATDFDTPLAEDLKGNIFLAVARSAYGLWKRKIGRAHV